MNFGEFKKLKQEEIEKMFEEGDERKDAVFKMILEGADVVKKQVWDELKKEMREERNYYDFDCSNEYYDGKDEIIMITFNILRKIK